METLKVATIPITKRGAEKLKAELHRLKTVDRPWVINAIASAQQVTGVLGSASATTTNPAMHASEKPRNMLPESPMNTLAGLRFQTKKPTHAPSTAALPSARYMG